MGRAGGAWGFPQGVEVCRGSSGGSSERSESGGSSVGGSVVEGIEDEADEDARVPPSFLAVVVVFGLIFALCEACRGLKMCGSRRHSMCKCEGGSRV
ncbi:hypothetical protein SUGI_0661860 [Cryptomeria japonica]|nr:hypothetical protein SUGI_0661860 [Cryptomeria japonica]